MTMNRTIRALCTIYSISALSISCNKLDITMSSSFGNDSFSIENVRTGEKVESSILVFPSNPDFENKLTCQKGDELIIGYKTEDKKVKVTFSYLSEAVTVDNYPYEIKYNVDVDNQIFEVSCYVEPFKNEVKKGWIEMKQEISPFNMEPILLVVE